jgi:glucose-1-phosphate thymidylyltransferase
MMTETLKIIIPMAGFGTRLRPHTWSRPKPLLSAAGDTILGHVLKLLQTAPGAENAEMVFIVGWLGEQVQAYMQAEHPKVKAHFVQQKELKGQSHALAQARTFMHGPTLIIFVDTVVETDFSGLDHEEADAVAWVKPVPDPRRFGVAELQDGWVRGLIEKPSDMKNNLAVVGIYYFKRGEDLMAAIDEQMDKGVLTKNEFFLADAIDILLKKGLRMRTEIVDEWLDAGLPDTVLETNRKLLEKGRDNSGAAGERKGVTIKPPVYIHPEAAVENSTLGPYVSIGKGSMVRNSTIEDAVVEREVTIEDCKLTHSLLGERSKVRGVNGSVNVGDDSSVNGETSS